MDEQWTPKSTESGAGNSIRHSTGKVPSSRSDEKVLPHYLRASTGSCHDFCKFGSKHEFEEKKRLPLSRRNARKLPDELNSMELRSDSNRTSKVTSKSISSAKMPPDTPAIIKQELPVPRRPLDRKSPVMNVVVAEKKKSSGALFTKSADSQSPVLKDILAVKKTMTKDMLTESVDSQISVSSDNWAEKRKSSLREKNKTSVVNEKTSARSKTRLSTEFIGPRASPSSERLEVSSKHASSARKAKNMAAKCANSVKLKSSSPDSSRVLNVQGHTDNRVQQKMLTSKVAKRKVNNPPRALLFPKTSSGEVSRVASPRASLFVKPTLRVQMSPRTSLSCKPPLKKVASLNARKRWGSEVPSLLKNQSKMKEASDEHIENSDHNIKEHKGDEVLEKTLYVIKMNTENNYLESDRNENLSAESSPPPSSTQSLSLLEIPLTSSNNEEDEEESEYAASEIEDGSISEYEETEDIEEADAMKEERRGWSRKPGMTPSDDKSDLPVKLRFRRGKVIDVTTEHNSPRRLKFRRARVLGENQNMKADTQKSFKRGGAEDFTKDSNPDSEKVVLRHQDVHGQKDAQGLFNNVIEETASKLVETRKSKVKALVGAFETVISLQDSKAPGSTAS